jgi:NADH dehydrogenase
MAQSITFGLFTNNVVTRDQLKLLRSDNVVAEDAKTLADLGITATPTEGILESYLWPFRPSGQYAAIKDSAKNLS